jgi:hypothetical protein
VNTSSVRKSLLACSAIALIMLVTACSGGSDRVSVGTSTTRASRESVSGSTSTSGKAAARKHAAKHKKPSTTSTTRAGAASHTATTTTSGSVVVPLGDPTTTAYTPPTASPTTAPHPTTTVCTPKPYDPAKAIDLSCSPGVTPAEQARAEELIRDTLRDLPKYADPNVAYTDGYRSIEDGFTGDEHYVNWAYLNDGHILDSKRPESLVYDTRSGGRKLVAAMYMMDVGDTFADVPDVGGPLTQWHVHNDLCLGTTNDPLQKVISSLTTANGTCPAGTTKAGAVPMIHVWIVKNACGPFASLEGVGAGQVPPGETRDCDTAHGSV